MRHSPKYIRAAAVCASIWSAASGQGCAPVFSDFQDARVQAPRTVQVTPSFSSVSATGNGETDHVQNQLGAQIAFGVNRTADFRGTFTRVNIPGEGGVNVVGFGPKFSLVQERVALYAPIGFAFGPDFNVSDTWQVHPTILTTVPLSGRVDLNPSAKVLIPLHSEFETTVAFNLGAGLGPESRRWRVRPEVGILVNPGDSGVFWSVGVGVSFSPGNP